jgi:signal transduction histidine kinase
MRAELDVALGDPQLDPSARGVLESARDEVDRMARMVDDMLTLAQIDEGRLELVTEPVDLRELAPEIEGEPAIVEGDRMRLGQALGDLVENARKYGGGEVRVETWERGDEVGLAVEDDGPGIAPDQRTRIFERFVRLDEARGRGGSGLGLAICAEVAAAHGGRAWMEPRDGGGSRFVIALPRARAGHERAAELAARAPR